MAAGLECLSVGGLAELADELQRCVHEYSEELVTELARRDELDFEKELKNQFIWLLLRVQRRRRQLQQIETRAAVTGLHETPVTNTEVQIQRGDCWSGCLNIVMLLLSMNVKIFFAFSVAE